MDENVISNILSRFGATSKIGEAVFGKVYSGRIGDRQVAIKIEPAVGSLSDEAENLAHLRALRQSAPPEIRKHLPEVYDIQTRDGVHVYVIELLTKPDPHTLEHIYGSSIDGIAETPLWDHIVDGGPATEAVQSAVLDFSDDRWHDQQMLDNVWSVWATRASAAPGRDPAEMANYQEVFADIRQAVMQTVGLYWRAARRVPMAEATAAVAAACRTDAAVHMAPETSQFFAAAATATHIPLYDPDTLGPRSYFGVSRTESGTLPTAVQSLLATLQWLKANGLSWGDAHSGNIMMRPGTNDLVFIDFGLYTRLTVPTARATQDDITVPGRRPARPNS